MGMAALAPAAKIGAGLISSWVGSKLNKNPVAGGQVAAPSEGNYARSPEGNQATAGLTGVAGQQGREGAATGNMAGGYYRALIGGNTAALNAAVAPDRAAVSDTYAGAERGAGRLRGPARDRAQRDLLLAKTKQLGTLPFAARTNAVNAGAALSQQQSQTAASGYSAQNQAADQRQQVRLGDVREKERLGLVGAQVNQGNVENQRRTGGAFGDLFYDILNGIGGKGRGAGSVNGLPISPYQAAVPMVRP